MEPEDNLTITQRSPIQSNEEFNCKKCSKADSHDDMVECENCQNWFHFCCVGVSDEIKSIAWKCENCRRSASKASSIHFSRKSRASNSSSKKVALELEKLEMERALEESRIQAEHEQNEKQFQEEKELLKKQHALQQVEFTKRERFYKRYLEKKYELLKDVISEESIDEEEGSIPDADRVTKAVNQWLGHAENLKQNTVNEIGINKCSNNQDSFFSLQDKKDLIPNLHTNPINEPTTKFVFNNNAPPVNINKFPTISAQQKTTEVQNAMQHPQINSEVDNKNPNNFEMLLNSQQLASRQAISKELPNFNGDPEEWPLFFSRYDTSTRVCGFSNDENLIRLQKSLKGEALQAVRSRLLLPTNVPNIINTLKRLYGKPEMIINSLLKKLRSEPAPKIEKLDSVIRFALAVENLCATMEVSNLEHHLANPLLLQELMDKLPSQLKIDWARYITTTPKYTISTFSSWLIQLSESLSKISVNVSTTGETKKFDKKSSNEKNFVQIHSKGSSQDSEKKSENQTLKEKKCCICDELCSSVKNCKKFQNSSLDEKWKAVKINNLCRTCLKSHEGTKCNSNKKCEKNGCSYRHNSLLHNDKTDQRQNDQTQKQEALSSQYSCTTQQQNNHSVLFRIIPVVLYGENRKIHTFAFLDEGSSLTLIEQNLADELQLYGSLEPLCLKWTANTHRIEKNSHRVSLTICGTSVTAAKYTLSGAHTVKSLNLPVQTLATDILFKKYKYLKGLPVNSYKEATPRILIGLDNSKLITSLKIKEGNQNQPLAVKTRLGWNIYGPFNKAGVQEIEKKFNGFHICECESSDKSLQDMVKNYFLLDSLGVKTPVKSLDSKENERSFKIMDATTQKIGNRYETGLLWKYDHIVLPDSFSMAKRRFDCLEKKMLREPELASILQNKMREYEEKQYIHKLSKNELQILHPRIWYLPIFTITNPNKPGKTRMVWDAAAKVNGVSLNSMLMKGPDQLASLPAVLYRFRERKIAICGDIREMFHQIRIRTEDRHAQRFLWRDSPKKEFSIYEMDVMTFGASCSPSSAQYIKNKNAENFTKKYPRAVEAITKNHYVDDWLDSLDTEEEMIQLARDVKFVHNEGGFEIRNWISNSKNVVHAMGEENNQIGKNLDVDSQLCTEKVLGIWWSTSSDTFTYSLKYNKMNEEILSGSRRPTKREVLKLLMKIYDPLGIISHFLIYLKILLQSIWKSSVDWDDQILDDQHKKWLAWIKVLPQVEKLEIPRCYRLKTSINLNKVQLHIFVDASEDAYAAVAYLRIGIDNEVECSLVGAKTRVAPIKLLSIPRLELQAALLGSRLAANIQESHSIKITERYFWTDSKTVLCWLKSDQRRFKQFVAFRIGEILESTEVQEWRWISSKENVADEATKWRNLPYLNKNSKWFTGPKFLQAAEEEWPQNNFHFTDTNEEIRLHLKHDFIILPNLIQVERFSKWSKLVRTVAYVLRFVHNVTSEKSSPLYKQSAYLDNDGVLRIRGRIDAAIGVESCTKRPIILPRTHYITRLIIKSFHQRYHHHNHETVVNELRQIYSISRLRVALKSEYKNCQLCKNQNAVPEAPEMADLPASRLSSFTRPFSYIGIDYFGPITVKIGRRSEKRWGALITCLTTRAIHIEVAHTLSTDSCILCLRNFMSRRGIPIEIYSDNGTNLRGAEHEIRQSMENINQSKLAEEFSTSTTKWMFIPPASPHMGGSWERLVKSVKKTLYQIMPSRNPSDELLKNMLTEVENIVNSRPLTYVPIDDENDEALTPNHFLLGSSSGMKPLGDFNDDHVVLKKNWMTSQNYANAFWKRWVREYLPTLTRRTKWFQPVKPIVEGDIVIIVDEKSPRNTWTKGRIVKTKTSKDGQVRSATVQTSTGLYERPAVKLAVLDVSTKLISKPIDDATAIRRGMSLHP